MEKVNVRSVADCARFFCIIGKNWYMNVDRDDCISVEEIFDDCKYHSGNDGIDINSIYLTFDDACKKIENNYRIISYATYVFLAAGVIFVITFVVGLFLGKKES